MSVTKHCECRFDENGKQLNECDEHLKQKIAFKRVLPTFLESKIKLIFEHTHLVEMRDKVIYEIRRLK